MKNLFLTTFLLLIVSTVAFGQTHPTKLNPSSTFPEPASFLKKQGANLQFHELEVPKELKAEVQAKAKTKTNQNVTEFHRVKKDGKVLIFKFVYNPNAQNNALVALSVSSPNPKTNQKLGKLSKSHTTNSSAKLQKPDPKDGVAQCYKENSNGSNDWAALAACIYDDLFN